MTINRCLSLLQRGAWSWVLLLSAATIQAQDKMKLSDLETKNMFQAMPPPSSWPISFWITLFILVFGSTGAVFGIRYLRERQAQAEMEQIADEQAQMGLDSELEGKKVEDTTRNFLHELCGTDDPIELLPVVKDPKLFEQQVAAYKSSPRFKPDKLPKVAQLRTSLTFNVKNPEVPFLLTQMLVPNIRLECQLVHKNKMVNFITTVLEVHEDRFLIKPPMVKKRPANMKQFPQVSCQMRREGDADYEFQVRVLDQLTDGNAAVVLGHTDSIRKMVIRESERIPLGMNMDFSFIQEAQYDLEKNFGKEPGVRIPVSAKVVDMSAGGMMVIINSMPNPEISPGDVMEFHLARANLRGVMAASVVRVVGNGGAHNLHLKFRDVDQLVRIKLNQYLHRAKKSQQAEAA